MDLNGISGLLDANETCALFLSTKNASPQFESMLFYDVEAYIYAYTQEDIGVALVQIAEYSKRGFWVAGYITYEAGYGFEHRFLSHITTSVDPLIMFVAYKKACMIRDDKTSILRWLNFVSQQKQYSLSALKKTLTYEKYSEDIQSIHRYIANGDVYQINYTFPYSFKCEGDTFALFAELHLKQPVSFSAYISDHSRTVMSLSPELFFSVTDGKIITKPMKGTIARGRNCINDKYQAEELRTSVKNRAENIMIVDLLRNDLGKICKTGSVVTSKLFDVEKYKRLMQMTSTVHGSLVENVSVKDIFSSIFPSGSVTGAPKIRAMEIIHDLEVVPRGIYTGSIGYVLPDSRMMFNVAIRTIEVDNATRSASMGIGSGIVADSLPDDEYLECELKAESLLAGISVTSLFETILFEDNEFYLIDYHIDRLLDSAQYFDIALKRSAVVTYLNNLKNELCTNCSSRIRIIVDQWGCITSESRDYHSDDGAKDIIISAVATSSNDIFLFHKTTHRSLYNKEYAHYSGKGYFDVIYLNENKYITEGAISNIFILKNDVYYTPPVECGLLAGTYRRYLLEKSTLKTQEKLLRVDDVSDADGVFMCNSVRKLTRINRVYANDGSLIYDAQMKSRDEK
ncbi:MAG: aminodeoxychorismate synthase component I [Candidatus Auribacterota bacterium]